MSRVLIKSIDVIAGILVVVLFALLFDFVVSKPANRPDVNRDGVVDLQDVSIVMYYASTTAIVAPAELISATSTIE